MSCTIRVILIQSDIHTSVTVCVIFAHRILGDVKAVAQGLINDVNQDVVYYAKAYTGLVRLCWYTT